MELQHFCAIVVCKIVGFYGWLFPALQQIYEGTGTVTGIQQKAAAKNLRLTGKVKAAKRDRPPDILARAAL